MPDEQTDPLDGRRTTKFVVDGREYDSVEEMPPDVQKIYGRAVAALSGFSADPDAPALEVVENEDGATTTRIVRSRRSGPDPADLAGGGESVEVGRAGEESGEEDGGDGGRASAAGDRTKPAGDRDSPSGVPVNPDELPPGIRETYERLMAGEHLKASPPEEDETPADPWIDEEVEPVDLLRQARWSTGFGLDRTSDSKSSRGRILLNVLLVSLCLALLGLVLWMG